MLLYSIIPIYPIILISRMPGLKRKRNNSVKKSVRISNVVKTLRLNNSNSAEEARKSGNVNRTNRNELPRFYRDPVERNIKIKRIRNHTESIRKIVGLLSPSKTKRHRNKSHK